MADIREQPNDMRTKAPSGGRQNSLFLIDEGFMVLMRLRLGLLVNDLASIFCISSTTRCRLLNKWIDVDVNLNFLIMCIKTCSASKYAKPFQI